MTAPTMPAWNLALRFMLEVAGLVGLAAAAWKLGSGPIRWIGVVLVPVAVSVVWVVFNVVEDPSRAGSVPVEVSGWIRLAIELAVLGAGAAAIGFVMRPAFGAVFALVVLGHYLASLDRVEWLLQV